MRHWSARACDVGLGLAGVLLSTAGAGAAPMGAAPAEIGSLAISLGLLVSTLASGFALVKLRARSGQSEGALRRAIAELRGRLDLTDAMSAADRQIIVTFGSGSGESAVEVLGAPPPGSGVPAGRRVLGFGAWMAPGHASAAEDKVARLRERGEAFEMRLQTREGAHIAMDGHAVGGRAVVRVRALEGNALELAELAAREAEMARELNRFLALLERLPQPVWMRDGAGRLSWVNAAYARAVDQASGEDAVRSGAELLESAVRREAAGRCATGKTFRASVPAMAGSERRLFDVIEMPQDGGSAGMAIDMSELEGARGDLVRRIDSHRKTLDELATGVAIFQADGKLAFHNQAFRQLFKLTTSYLQQQPTDSEILDRLRAAEMLPEPADFRVWKAQLQDAYRATDPREHWWYLPDRRTLRVVQTPNPEGGVTWLFDDVSERIDLESRYNALTGVQRETLDNLRDAVAVFGSDGRLKLHNPCFAQMWRLPEAELMSDPHADRVIALCRALHQPQEPWDLLKTAITAMPESRLPIAARIGRADGATIDLATVPLPDGATLVTFSDVTASVSMERALTDRNDALVAADHMKSAFVKHVSYELRAPLTNVIGFAQLLADPATGPLNTRQRDYAGHVLDSSAALYAIINDILDLATIDAGHMELDLGLVDIRAAADSAVEGVRDRLTESGIDLRLDVPGSIGNFIADEKRVRQVLFNLLSNAIGFSPQGGRVTLSAQRHADRIDFRVVDEGRGMPEEMLEKVFERFESQTRGSRHRGVGLGLSIVRSFVELHGGRVEIDSAPGRGTTVTCTFPLDGDAARVAAE